MFSVSLAIAACQKQSGSDMNGMNHDPQQNSSEKIMTDDAEFRTKYQGFIANPLGTSTGPRCLQIQDIENAYRDEYADINVILPNMGYHFMKQKISMQLLKSGNQNCWCTTKDESGKFELVAIEYAVPLDLLPDGPPEGFTGSADAWDHNTDFGLWTLHAWIWQFNPDGVFKPMNPNVIVR
jgi:hypothetical protein